MSGYIYCFSNASMPNILKVGMTERTPDLRLNEANNSGTWTIPSYKIVIAKKVLNPKQKELTLHMLLSQYTERIHPKREFFRVSEEEVKTLFDLIDGELWVKTPEEEEDEEEEDEDEDDTKKSSHNIKKHSRNMSKCFTDGQRLRHTIGINKTWIGIYDASKNEIICDMKSYKSLSGFAGTHYSIERPDRVNSANGWAECECEVNGKWISTYGL
jgi:hypothetical protein